MPFRRSGTERLRATPASKIVFCRISTSRAPWPSRNSLSPIAFGIFRRKPLICPSRILSSYVPKVRPETGIIPYRGFQLGSSTPSWNSTRGRTPSALLLAFTAAQTDMSLQVQAEKPVVQHICKGTDDCLKYIAAEEGVAAGLYKGFAANALRSVSCALVLELYDRANTFLCIHGSTGAASAIIHEPLSLCTKPSDTSQQCCKTFIATSSSVTCCGQPHFRSPSASEIFSQSAEPRPRPQYSKYTPDGTLICPDYNTRGCSLCNCWNKSLNAVQCCDVWGCSKNTLDGITDKRQNF